LENKSVTILDVAKAAGVSASTVSRVVNGYEHVRPAMRDRVEKAMRDLAFVPNRHARQLVTGRSGVVALVVHALGNEYIGEVIRGIEQSLGKIEADMMLYTTERKKTKEEYYYRRIVNGLADGVILVVPLIDENSLNVFYDTNFPHVLVDIHEQVGQSWSVGVTNWQGAYDATKYLIELNHRRIAILNDSLELSTSRSRLAGYQAALKDHGLPYDPLLFKEDSYMNPHTRKLTEELLALPNPPTGIFVTSDQYATRVMETLRLHGLNIPHDMSLIGFDDLPIATAVYPRLTTVQNPIFEMGQKAVEVLLDQIQTPELSPQHIQLKTELVTRESCLPLSPGRL